MILFYIINYYLQIIIFNICKFKNKKSAKHFRAWQKRNFIGGTENLIHLKLMTILIQVIILVNSLICIFL